MAAVMILEDDAVLRKNIALSLEIEGYQVLAAGTLAEAKVLAGQADLLLLDVLLPDGDGVAFCREFRKSSDTPVIFLTSCSEEAEIIRGLDSGGDDYITKPFRLRELLSRVRANLRRSTQSEPLEELTAAEQRLLAYLKQNRGQFLTREQLLEHLWDEKGCFVNDNTLSVTISRLREKLKGKGSGQIITKRGIGYKWTEQTD